MSFSTFNSMTNIFKKTNNPYLINTFSDSVSSTTYKQMMASSEDGNYITICLNEKIYVSSDGGNNFTTTTWSSYNILSNAMNSTGQYQIITMERKISPFYHRAIISVNYGVNFSTVLVSSITSPNTRLLNGIPYTCCISNNGSIMYVGTNIRYYYSTTYGSWSTWVENNFSNFKLMSRIINTKAISLLVNSTTYETCIIPSTTTPIYSDFSYIPQFLTTATNENGFVAVCYGNTTISFSTDTTVWNSIPAPENIYYILYNTDGTILYAIGYYKIYKTIRMNNTYSNFSVICINPSYTQSIHWVSYSTNKIFIFTTSLKLYVCNV
jgi:hypothetical protein